MSGVQPYLDFFNAWEFLVDNTVYDCVNIVLVELLNNKYYKKSIQTQPLRGTDVINIRKGGDRIRYDRHINLSKYNSDILKRKLVENSFSTVKDVYFKKLMEVINYLRPCIDFLDQFQMYQNIIINNNISDSAVYLGMYKGNIMYYSRQQKREMLMNFEQFKVAVKQDKGFFDKREKQLEHGEDMKELKKEIQRHKSIF